MLTWKEFRAGQSRGAFVAQNKMRSLLALFEGRQVTVRFRKQPQDQKIERTPVDEREIFTGQGDSMLCWQC